MPSLSIYSLHSLAKTPVCANAGSCSNSTSSSWNCHGLNSGGEESPTFSLTTLYLSLKAYTSSASHGVWVVSPVNSNHFGTNACPFFSRAFFSALCLSSNLIPKPRPRAMSTLTFRTPHAPHTHGYAHAHLDFSVADLCMSPCSSAALSGRSRESDGRSPGGAESKLLM